jgi:hypothetical protein
MSESLNFSLKIQHIWAAFATVCLALLTTIRFIVLGKVKQVDDLQSSVDRLEGKVDCLGGKFDEHVRSENTKYDEIIRGLNSLQGGNRNE